MKMLMLRFEKYAYWKDADDGRFEKGIIIFTHAEEKDEENLGKAVTKYVKNVKWFARKWDSNSVILHSFSHLSFSKASFESACEIIDKGAQRLSDVGMEVMKTPYGKVLNFQIELDDTPMARVFKEF